MSTAEARLELALRIRAIAQTGLEYCRDPYDRERFEELAGIAHTLIAEPLGVAEETIADIYLPERGYPTPKVDVRAGVFRDNKILLVQEASDQCWTLPGGWADEDLSPAACAQRETHEESGFEVAVVRLVAVKDRHLHPYLPKRLERIYKLFFLCELTGGAAATSLETSAVDWFALDDLPALSVGRTLLEDIALLADAQHQPDSTPCYFD